MNRRGLLKLVTGAVSSSPFVTPKQAISAIMAEGPGPLVRSEAGSSLGNAQCDDYAPHYGYEADSRLRSLRESQMSAAYRLQQNAHHISGRKSWSPVFKQMLAEQEERAMEEAARALQNDSALGVKFLKAIGAWRGEN